MDQETAELAEKMLDQLMDCSFYQRQSAALKEMFGPDAQLHFIDGIGSLIPPKKPEGK